MSELEIMSLIEQRDSLNERVNNLNEAIEMYEYKNQFSCSLCHDTGYEICDNPDHGFLDAISFTEYGRIGCPLCGHDVQRRIMSCKCSKCSYWEIQELKSLIKEAREIHFNGLEDGSLWVKINANNPIVKQWLEKAEKIKWEH